jgi:hypothetical protein
MPTLLTLATVRERLWVYTNNQVAYSAATQTQKDDADFRINQVVERFLSEGKWRGTLRRITLPIYDEYITLPRELGTILGIKLITDANCCCVAQLYTRFHEFATCCFDCCNTGVYAVSETAQTFLTPDAGFQLRVKSTVSEAKEISFYGGWDTDNEEYFGAETLTIINGSATTTREYNSMPPTGGIQKQVTTVPCELYSVDSDGNETLIAVYAPSETIPAYKKYKVPNCNSQFTSAMVFGKLAYVEAVEDSDIIIPSHWGALKIGLKALQSEDTEEDDMADQDWARAYRMLNADLTEAEGDSEQIMFKVASGFACDGIPNLI